MMRAGTGDRSTGRTRSNALTPLTRMILWARAGGRCQYAGCNKLLIGDLISGAEDRNFGFVAHVVADTPDGPRGDPVRSAPLSNDISNLMLLCHIRHKLIDVDDVAGHPEERLLAMKSAHEDRIETVTGIDTDRASHVVRYAANIGAHDSPVAYEHISAAMLPDRYPAEGRRVIDIALASSRFEDDEIPTLIGRMDNLHRLLRYSSSFLDRLEEVGMVTGDQAVSYGLVGPIARASGLPGDVRKLFPYAGYDAAEFTVPLESQGDGYARLRVFFHEAEQSAAIIRQTVLALPDGPVCADPFAWRAGGALDAVEAPQGAAFHWLRLDEKGIVVRYRVTPPAFPNWHGFHLAAENFAFPDFPIILASFGLSNAECDR